MATLLEGGCPCGAVRFRTRGDPHDWIRCDCGFCRGLTRVRGPGEPVWPNASVEFAGGTIGSVDHRSDDHPRSLTVHFCTACGAAVSLSLDGRRSLRCMLAATFDEPARLHEAAHLRLHEVARPLQDEFAHPRRDEAAHPRRDEAAHPRSDEAAHPRRDEAGHARRDGGRPGAH